MAGRFNLDSLQKGRDDQLHLNANFNICPAQTVPAIVREETKSLRLMTWGLVPSWAKDRSIGQKMINARCETLAEKPAFKRLLGSRRCIIPASGFYEWKKEGKGKIPMYFRLRSGGIFGFAGLWDLWRPEDGQGRDHYSFTIITTTPNDLLSQVHHRMLAILRSEDEDRWLDPNLKDPTELCSMLKHYLAEEMEGYPVTPAVNSPSYHAPDCVKPLAYS